MTARTRLRRWRRLRPGAQGWAPPHAEPPELPLAAPPSVDDLPAPPPIRGAVDAIGADGTVSGWVSARDGAPARVFVVHDGVTLGEATAAPDLQPGIRAFSVSCPAPPSPLDVALGRVRVLAAGPADDLVRLPVHGDALAEGVRALVREAAGEPTAPVLEDLLARLDPLPDAPAAPPSAPGPSEAARMEALLSRLPPNPRRGAEGIAQVGVPVGKVSPDGSVVMGHGGHLFLVEGSNGLLHQHLLPADGPDVTRLAKAWLHVLEARARSCDALGCRFLQVVIPEKLSVLPDFLPRALSVPTPLWRALETAVAAQPALAGRYLSALPVLSRRGLAEEAFPRLDTHLSARGAYEVFVAICTAMGFGRPFPDAPFRREVPGTGDIADRLFPGQTLPETHYWPMAELAALWPTPALVEEHDPGRHIGRRLVWRTPDAPIQARVVAFANSFFERGGSPRSLSWWFARGVSEFHFCWQPEMDDAYVRAQRPDWVICQTVERFLPQVPAR